MHLDTTSYEHHLSLSTMSTASKITLVSTAASAVGIVIFVHYAQKAEQSVRPATRTTPHKLILARQCTQVCSEIWNSKESNENALRTLRCSDS